jgi:hypothetical protein
MQWEFIKQSGAIDRWKKAAIDQKIKCRSSYAQKQP